MKVISILNLKGGIGKTTTAINFSHGLHTVGKKVIMIDNDKQGNLSKAFKVYRQEQEPGVAKLLRNNWEDNINNIITYTEYPDLHIVTSNMHTMTATYELENYAGGGRHTKYKEFARKIDKDYDYMIIDNPPDLGFNVINALAITDEVIIPVKIDEWALEGLEVLKDQVEQVKAINPKIHILGVLITEYRNNDTNATGLEWIEKKTKIPVIGKIKYSEKAAESTFFRVPVAIHSPRSGVARGYRALVNNYILGEERESGEI